jgi:SET domain-containing protein
VPESERLCSRIEVRSSPVHGTGVFATGFIASGTAIGRYTGRRYGVAEQQSRDWDNALTYVFGLSDGSVINGAEGGNATRHINHACKPNCLAYEVEADDGILHIEIESAMRIKAGQELFLDYKLDAGAAAERGGGAYVCQCGAPGCRGTMLGSDSV